MMIGVGNMSMMDNCPHSPNAFQHTVFGVSYWHLHHQAMTPLQSSACKGKHVYQIRNLHAQGKRGGYMEGTALMDSAHFLLLCNRDGPVRAGARADGGFVCVWIRIGEVLFYSFSVTAQEKGKRRRDGRVQTGRRWKPRLTRALFHSVITGVLKVPRLMLPLPDNTHVYALKDLQRHTHRQNIFVFRSFTCNRCQSGAVCLWNMWPQWGFWSNFTMKPWHGY